MTITTRPIVSTRVNFTSAIDASTASERSDIRSTCREGGSEARISGIVALTWSTILVMLAPGWRKISSTSAFLLLYQAPVRGRRAPSITSAMSRILTGAPLRKATITSR